MTTFTPTRTNLVLSSSAPTVLLAGPGVLFATNIRSLPLISVEATTSTNEDWRDGFAFFEDEAGTIPILLDGIDFEMEVRHLATDATVVLRGTSADGSLVVNFNALVLNFTVDRMKLIPPLDYVFDIVMRAEDRTRVLARGNLTVTLGVTR